MTEPEHNSMHLSAVTLQDDALTHQVRFSLVRQRVAISCNCRATTGKHEKAGKLYYERIGFSESIEESRRLYNDPDNHWAPFGKEDEAKW